MPWNDWQFWLVTALAIGCAWLLLRSIIPFKRRNTTNAAGGSHGGSSRRVPLTIERKKVK